MPYRLIPAPPGQKEVGEALAQLQIAFDNGQLTGLAFVAVQRRSRYIAEVVGSCVTNPTFTRGAVWSLSDKLASMQHHTHPEETR
jgi:hypothetical protein